MWADESACLALCNVKKNQRVLETTFQCGKTDPVEHVGPNSLQCKEKKTKSVGNYFLHCGKTTPVEHIGPNSLQ
jgi:hypothetical protein